MACCVGKKYDNWCEDEDPIYKDSDGNEYCIFHAPAELKGMGWKEFNSLVRKRLQNKFYQKDIDLRGTIFLDEIMFSSSNLPLFKENKKHPNINLSHSKFANDLLIKNIDLYGELDLSNCTFYGRTRILNAYFERKLTLTNSAFYNHITFQEAQFQSIFVSEHLFINNNSLSILNCTFEHSFILKLATNPSTLRLNFTICHDVAVITENLTVPVKAVRIRIQKPLIDTVVTLQGLFFKKIILPKTLIFPIFFSKCLVGYFSSGVNHFKTALTFSTCKFQEIYLTTHNIQDINFCGCSFPLTSEKRIITSDAAPYIDIPTQQPTERVPKTFHYLEDLYRKLKQQAQTQESGMESSDWHYWEKFFAQKRLQENDDKLNSIILWWYHLLSGYGESVKRASLIMLLILLCTLPLAIARDSCLFYSDNSDQIKVLEKSTITAQGYHWKSSYLSFPDGAWDNFKFKSALDFIPLATLTPTSKDASLWRLVEIAWQILITFQATLLGFALRNRYRR